MQGGLVALGSLAVRSSRGGEFGQKMMTPWKRRAGLHQCERKYGDSGDGSTGGFHFIHFG